MSAEVTFWDIKFNETGVDGRPTISARFGLGHDQEVKVNVRPELASEVAKSFLLAHSDFRGWEEINSEERVDIREELSHILSRAYAPDSDYDYRKVLEAIQGLIEA